jgi:phage terminase small subunit
MAGVKGRSGGARPGAGRKPKIVSDPIAPEVMADIPGEQDPKAFLLSVMNDPGMDGRHRLEAAKALLPFMHPKLGEGGKKDTQADRAKKASTGKFAAAPAPLKLVARR